MPRSFSRRAFITRTAAASAGVSLGLSSTTAAQEKTAVPATGMPVAKRAIEWPVWDAREESALLDVLRSGKWGRAGGVRVGEFEGLFAKKMQARFCVATSSGTTALLSALGALDIGPGDEVILPPYTFVATFNAITSNYALPVFVDTDAATFQIDPKKITEAITPNTKLLLPVHIGGAVADMDAINAIARPRDIPVIEDACQAHLAEWRGRPVGTQGIGGCFSFQATKNMPAGEGGAIVTDDEAFANRCFNFHTPTGHKAGATSGRGANYRLTEFQAALLIAQMSRLDEQTKTRDSNAAYLTGLLEKIPGIVPVRQTEGCTRNAYHMYMLRYDRRQFANLPRAKFLEAINKKGLGASSPYTPLNQAPHVRAIMTNRHYLQIYGRKAMEHWAERNRCPINDRVCEEAFRISHTKLLGPRADMERMAEVIAGVQQHAGELVRG